MPAKNKPVAASAADAPVVVKQEKAGKRFRLINYGKSGAVESLLINLAGPMLMHYQGSMTGKDARFQRLAERFISEIPVHRDVLLKTLAAAQAEEYRDEENIAYLQQAVADVQQFIPQLAHVTSETCQSKINTMCDKSTTNIPGSMTAVVDSDV
ncbi:hypothetical protein COO60DRAFT_1698286 [Scenedesmus sp. NREL 46B-D3]|nr:hypothetical protein COO60DRAFT_1702852 [Scenedesmus sp. NREL 46B-D3]KAF6264460.1 hypothetical protein COO60DRAFT_1698286 [Scenedesmus sp. NREL 46B-D3]